MNKSLKDKIDEVYITVTNISDNSEVLSDNTKNPFALSMDILGMQNLMSLRFKSAV